MHSEAYTLLSLASIMVLGIGAHWLAWRLGLPSILILLVVGFVVGPATAVLQPSELFGDLLFPMVSLSVGIILFEGGMSLRLSELQDIGKVVGRLVSVGALVTWVLSTLAATLIIGLPLTLSMLLGAILVVTGPTVIGPLLRDIRPSRRVGDILKWEGIVIDPVGASLALLVFEAVLAEGLGAAAIVVLEVVVGTILVGTLLGAVGAGLFVVAMRRYWVPDHLQNPVALMLVVGVFAAANMLQEESGLLAVTVMGVLLANQRAVNLKHILHFQENLRVLLIAGLFVLLTARLQPDSLAAVGGASLGKSLLFLGVILLVVRPLSVALSTLRSGLTWRERLFLAWMAPRGIVAASVASLFALRLRQAEVAQVEALVPLTFLVIAGTVLIYSLTARHVAGWLGVARPNPQGVLIVGAHELARTIGRALQRQGYEVMLVDTNLLNNQLARAEGLRTFHGSILSEELREDIALGSIGRLLALTPNDEINALAALEWADVFGRSEVYQILPGVTASDNWQNVLPPLRGRPLFGIGLTYDHLADQLGRGGTIEISTVSRAIEGTNNRSIRRPVRQTDGATPAAQERIPLFVLAEDRVLRIVTADRPLVLRPGQVLISMCEPQPPLDAAPAQPPKLQATRTGTRSYEI